MKGEFDVIQVAENDFTSSNLRLYTKLFVLCGDFIATQQKECRVYKIIFMRWNSDAKGKTISFGENETWAESGLEFTGRQFHWPGLAAELLMSRTNFNI